MADGIAGELAAALVEDRLIDPISAALIADDAAVAVLAERARDAVGWDLAGWKIGATSARAQSIMATDRPFFGPVFAPRVFENGATIPLPPGLRGFECEFAFRLGAHLPPRPGGYDAASLRPAIDAVVPAIELIATRQRLDGMGDARLARADFGFNHGLVLGRPVVPPPLDALGTAEAVALVDEQEVGRGSGADVLGHPLHALAWLTARGVGLRAGDLISTGTCTGIATLGPGASGEGDFGVYGRVRFTAAPATGS